VLDCAGYQSEQVVPGDLTLVRSLRPRVYRQGRLLVMAAVKNGLALIATAEGPKVIFTHKNSDHPSAVNLMIASALGASVNSFTWNEGSPK
jgi:hypothetical protein